jgi:uncharacterized protein (TIRG00374 family)
MQQQTIDRRRGWNTAAKNALSVLIVAVMLLGVLPLIGSFGQVREVLVDVDAIRTISVLTLSVASMASFWIVTALSLPGVSVAKAAVVKQASTAVANTIVAGGALAVGLTYRMFRAEGFTTPVITRSVLVTGVWNIAAKLLLAVTVVAAMPTIVDAGSTIVSIGALIFFLVVIFPIAGWLTSDRVARAAGSAVGFVVDSVQRFRNAEPVGHWKERASTFRRDALEFLDDRWVALTAAVFAAQLSLFAVFLGCVWAVTSNAPNIRLVETLAVFAGVRLVTALPLTPGALGIAEVGYAAGLSTVVGISGPDAVAATVLFRAATWLIPTLAGYVALIVWWARRRQVSRSAS